MKTEYLFATLDPDGSCFRIDGGETVRVVLSKLLAEGWRPVRETPFAPNPSVLLPSMLIVLEREIEGSFGFGFGPGRA